MRGHHPSLSKAHGRTIAKEPGWLFTVTNPALDSRGMHRGLQSGSGFPPRMGGLEPGALRQAEAFTSERISGLGYGARRSVTATDPQLCSHHRWDRVAAPPRTGSPWMKHHAAGDWRRALDLGRHAGDARRQASIGPLRPVRRT